MAKDPERADIGSVEAAVTDVFLPASVASLDDQIVFETVGEVDFGGDKPVGLRFASVLEMLAHKDAVVAAEGGKSGFRKVDGMIEDGFLNAKVGLFPGR